MEIIEQFICSKTGSQDDCEDLVYTGKDFIAVIDGVTSKSSKRYGGRTQGYLAASLVYQAINQLPHDCDSYTASVQITDFIKQVYLDNNMLELMEEFTSERFSATSVIYSNYREEIWIIGNCQGFFNHKHITNTMLIDTITSEARSLFIQIELQKGKTIEELLKHDTGRGFIYPILEQESCFENKYQTEYGYSVFNGISVPMPVVYKVDRNISNEVILATDGYPVLMPTLKESEEMLEYSLKTDPLRINQFKSTKGLKPGNSSYDDRAFVRFRI